jgi:hypothetical protein
MCTSQRTIPQQPPPRNPQMISQLLIKITDLTHDLTVFVCLFMAVTEARSCTKGSVLLINYSLTNACSPSVPILASLPIACSFHCQLLPPSRNAFPLSRLLRFVFCLSRRKRNGKLLLLRNGEGTEIIIYSYYDFLHKFHYTYFVYFPEGCSEFDDDFRRRVLYKALRWVDNKK